jgi:glycosyltransferase involved in cell wall biosynthesis
VRVVHVNNADVGHGGAALAAYRLHRALPKVGVQSEQLVAFRSTADPDVSVLRQWPRVRRAAGYVMRRVGLNDLVGIGAYGVPSHPAVQRADLVHLHLLEGNWFSYPAVARISAERPIVWTLHDMWPLTGHCSYSYECDRWRTGCGACPHLDVFPVVKRDATAVEHRLKAATYARSDITVLAPCRWLGDLASDGLLGRFPVHVVGYPLDTELFAPRSRAACRQALGLADDDFVLAVAAAAFDDRRKGADLLVAALAGAREEVRRATTVLILGSMGRVLAEALHPHGIRTVDLDYVFSDALKVTAYNAADLFVLPTRADNSPLVLLESLGCGTPGVSFAVGGVPETIQHERTGLLADAEDAAGMAAAIERLWAAPDERRRMGEAGRALIVERHDEAVVAARHREIYEEALERRRLP